jgi:hypothetical protein
VKLGRLIADSVPGVDAAQLLDGVLDGVDQGLTESYQRHIARAASRHLSPWPLRVTVVFPPATGLAMARVLLTLLRLRAHLTGPLACRGLDMWASSPQRGLGGEVSRWQWSHPCRGWCPVRPLPSGVGLNRVRSGVEAAPVGTLRQLCGSDGVNTTRNLLI